MMNEPAKIPVILLVEDCDDDVFFVHHCLEKVGIKFSLSVVENGEDAIFYLSGENQYADRAQYPLPDLVLLDLMIPIKDGFEVLLWVQQQSQLKSLRIIVLTATEQARNENRAYQLGAKSFLTKPITTEMGHFILGCLGLGKPPEISMKPQDFPQQRI